VIATASSPSTERISSRQSVNFRSRPWLDRLETQITERVLGDEAAQIPPEWYAGDWDSLDRLLERLYRRRDRVRELILAARNSGREPFPNWKVKHA